MLGTKPKRQNPTMAEKEAAAWADYREWTQDLKGPYYEAVEPEAWKKLQAELLSLRQAA